MQCFNGGLIRNHIFWEIEHFEDHQKKELIEKEYKGKACKERKQRKINIREKGGHNSEPTEQTYY